MNNIHLSSLQSIILGKIGMSLVNKSHCLKSFGTRVSAQAALSRGARNLLKKNLSLKGVHRGKPASIIMTGPSLATQDISGLGSLVTYTASGFYRHSEVDNWSPNYYLFSDRAYFHDTPATLNYFDEFNKKISSETVIFANMHRGHRFFDHNNELLKNREVYYYLGAGASLSSRHSAVDFSSITPVFWGSSAVALALAIWSECNPIYLLGFDHNYLANRYGGLDEHFYQGQTIDGYVLPGFDKADIPLIDRNPYDWEMLMNYRLWQNYRWLARAASSKNIQIFNCTPTPYLDVFPRQRWEHVRKQLSL